MSDQVVIVLDRELAHMLERVLPRLERFLDGQTLPAPAVGGSPAEGAPRRGEPTATLSVPEVARRIGVSKNTLYRSIYETGEVLPGVPAFKVRSSWRVSTEVLERSLRSSPSKG